MKLSINNNANCSTALMEVKKKLDRLPDGLQIQRGLENRTRKGSFVSNIGRYCQSTPLKVWAMKRIFCCD